MGTRDSHATPIVSRLLVGWCVGAAWVGLRPPVPPPRILDPGCTLEQGALPLPPPSPREWRTVAGVGRSRAIALARAQWSERGAAPGSEFDPEAVKGIGPVTGRRVRQFLEKRLERRTSRAYGVEAVHSSSSSP